jgi:hypothetical protein
VVSFFVFVFVVGEKEKIDISGLERKEHILLSLPDFFFVFFIFAF